MTTFSDNTLERQLSSLFRAEAQDAHLPLGTWQAISPRMGEPDALSVFRRITDAISFPRWRNPMKVRYATSAATIAMIVIAAILFVMLVNADDSEGPVPAATPTPRTETPVPATPTVAPTPAESSDLRNPDTSTLDEKPIPAAIDPALVSEVPSDEVVVQAWTEYFSDSIFFYAPQANYHFCGDGRIVSVDESNKADLTLGEPGTWRLAKSAAAPSANWWETSFRGKLNAGDDLLISLFVVGIENGSLTTTADGGQQLTVYDSEYCKQVVDQVPQLPTSKPFPAELRSDASPLSSEQVIALWTEYLSGTDIFGEHLSRHELQLCGDGTGASTITQANAGRRIVPIGSTNSSVDKMVFDWEVGQVSNRWNEVSVRMPLTKGPADTFAPLLDIQRFWEEDGVIIGRDYETLAIVEVTDNADCSTAAEPPQPAATSTPFDASAVAEEFASALETALEAEFETAMELDGEPTCRVDGDVCTLALTYSLESNPVNSYLDEPIDEMALAVLKLGGETSSGFQNSTHGSGGGLDTQDGPFYRFRVFVTTPMTIGGREAAGQMVLSDGSFNVSLDIELKIE